MLKVPRKELMDFDKLAICWVFRNSPLFSLGSRVLTKAADMIFGFLDLPVSFWAAAKLVQMSISL